MMKNELAGSHDTENTRRPTIAGVLNMVSGIFGIMVSFGGCMNVVNGGRTQDAWMLVLVIPGALALVGGVYARRRSNWSLALVGSICAIPAVLGLVSTALVLASKKEFAQHQK